MPKTPPPAPRAPRKPGILNPTLIVERRVELGLLQKEVARRAGISPQLLADIECGRRNGSPKTRAAIARALYVTPKELMWTPEAVAGAAAAAAVAAAAEAATHIAADEAAHGQYEEVPA